MKREGRNSVFINALAYTLTPGPANDPGQEIRGEYFIITFLENKIPFPVLGRGYTALLRNAEYELSRSHK